MSFILDALRKSEIERQRQSDGDFSSIPTSTEAHKTPRWVWIVSGLLAINIAAIAFFFLRDDASAKNPTLEANAIETVAPTKPRKQPEPSTAESINFSDQVAATPRIAPSTIDVIETPPETEPLTADVVAAEPAQVSARDAYPTLQTVIASGRMSLPPLHLDIHVFSEKPNERFVFINMTKQREGSQLDEGPVVHEITPDGVVLAHRGQYFILPRE